MKFGLIANDMLVEVTEEKFDVHPSFLWVECDDDVTAETYSWDGEKIVKNVTQK